MDEKIIVALASVYGYILKQVKDKSRNKPVRKAKINSWRLAAKLDICEDYI